MYNDSVEDFIYNENGKLSSHSISLAYLQTLTTYRYNLQYTYLYDGQDRLTKTNLYMPKHSGSISYTYDDFGRLSQKENNFYLTSNTSNRFDNTVEFGYTEQGGNTSSQVSTYTSTVGSVATAYTYTYDQNGNITKIKLSTGYEIRYYYDNIGQLIREDNGQLSKTYVYAYDNAGNLLSKKTYALTAENVTPTSLTSTVNYTYSAGSWGDMLTSFNGNAITYDELGNPLVYHNGASFTWQGRSLVGATYNGKTLSFTYDDNGLRTSKTVNGVTTNYYWSAGQLIAEETSGNMTVYLYDDSGSPIGFQYREPSYAKNVWDVYWYEKNLHGDIVAIYNSSGIKYVSYTYDAWGKAYTTNYVGATILPDVVDSNPFKYRGYYYDADLGLYYLGSRYYDADSGRFISPDTFQILTATPMALTDKNLYAYCDNNPIMRVDRGGEWWVFANAFVGAVVGATTKIVSNVLTGEDWNDGVIGAAIGGSVYGVVLATTANIALAGYSSAAAESLVNEVTSYVPKLSTCNGEEKTKELKKENLKTSLNDVFIDTAINGTISTITGKVASKIVLTNNGWIAPKKFTSSFIGNYAKKAHLQTLIQGIELLGVNCFHYQGMQSLP